MQSVERFKEFNPSKTTMTQEKEDGDDVAQ